MKRLVLRSPFVVIVLASVLTLAGGWAFALIRNHGHLVPEADPAIPQDAQAALAGVGAYYTIDHAETADQWADRVCPYLATDGDCTVTRALIAPEIYHLAQRHQIKTGCTVYPLGRVYESPDTLTRIWQMQVTLTHPWEDVENPQAVYAVVVYDETSGLWSMQRVLFANEAELLEQILAQQEGAQP